ncbi:MAG: hypothetical protein AAGN66_11985 [Acidobacteriota bacterium]
MQHRKSLILFMSSLMFLVLAADAWASATCKTRSRCRWWSKKYIAKAKVSCWGMTLPLCYKRSSSCGNANAYCGWKSCLWGGATASASNGPGGCSVSGSRSGLGRYGETLTTPAEPGSKDGMGAHDALTRVEYEEREGAVVHFDHFAMGNTLDTSFSRVDVVAYIESEEGLANDDDDFLPERVVWSGYIHLQDGVVSHKGFEEVARDFQGQADIEEVILTGLAKRIPFEGTADEFDRLAVEVIIDGGQPEAAR